VDESGSLPPKFPPGQARQAAHLRTEGHAVSRAWRVKGFQNHLVRR
jgi:hypothetical protein